MKRKLKKLLVKLYYIFRYPFMKPQGRAYVRWFFTGSEKKRYEYNDLNEDSLILDVGGYHGDFSQNIHDKYGCECYIFEPVHEFYYAICQRFEGNSKIRVWNCGLSGRSEREEMEISEDGSSSVIDRESSVNETVDMKDVFEFITENNIRNIDLMKINIEGGEYSLLERMIECGCMSMVNHFQIQFHEVADMSENRMKYIQKELEKSHILEWACRPYIWESWKKR